MTFWSDVEYSVVSLVVITRPDCTTKSGFLVKMSICNKDIVTEDINGLIICPNVQKSSDYAKKS